MLRFRWMTFSEITESSPFCINDGWLFHNEHLSIPFSLRREVLYLCHEGCFMLSYMLPGKNCSGKTGWFASPIVPRDSISLDFITLVSHFQGFTSILWQQIYYTKRLISFHIGLPLPQITATLFQTMLSVKRTFTESELIMIHKGINCGIDKTYKSIVAGY